MRQNALPILEAAGVDLVLAGHSHSYERSYLIDGHYGTSGTFNPATHQLDGGDGRTDGNGAYEKPTAGLAPNEGAVYVTAGSSGKISGGSLNHPAMFLSLNALGSVVLDINDTRMDVQFLRETGVIDDYLTILKGVPPSPDAVAQSEISSAGTVSGTYIDTRLSDNVYESIEERSSGGNTSPRASVCMRPANSSGPRKPIFGRSRSWSTPGPSSTFAERI